MTYRSYANRVRDYQYKNHQREFFNIANTSPKLWMSADRNVGTSGARVLAVATSEYFRLATKLSPPADFWVSFWVKPVSLAAPDGSSLFIDTTTYGATGTGFRVGRVNITGLITATFGDASNSTYVYTSFSDLPLTANKWDHIVVTFNRMTGLVNVYRNAVISSDTLNISSFSAACNAGVDYASSIGSLWDGFGAFANDSLSRFAFGQGVLPTSVEIAELYNQGNGKYYAELSLDLSNKVTHYWNMNEVSGNAIDAKGNNDGTDMNTVTAGSGPREALASDNVGGYHGVLTNMDTTNAWSSDVPNVPSCLGGYSLTFDGTDDKVIAGNVLIGASARTYSAWIKLNGVGGGTYGRIFDDGKCIFYIQNGVRIANSCDGALTEGSSALFTSLVGTGWHHVVASHPISGATIAHYLDGADISNVGTVGTPQSGTSPFAIGGRQADNTRQFDGKIDDLRIYNVQLSAADITLLAAGNEPATAPLARWTFNDGPQGGAPSDGDPISTWESREGNRYQANQVTASLCPTYIRGAVNGQPAIDFDGVDDFLEFVDAIGISTGAGHCMIVSSQDANKLATIYGQADEAVATRFFELGTAAAGFLSYNQNDAGAVDTLNGNSALGTSYKLLEVSSNGTLVAMKVNQVVQTITVAAGNNNGDWAGDVTGPDNAMLGALKTTSVSKYFAGRIAEFIYWDSALSSADANAVRVELAKKYGIVLV